MYNHVDIISETYEDMHRENCKFVSFNHPTPVWRQYLRNAFEYIEMIYTARN